MLNYSEALELLHRYGGDAPWTRHCVAVSRVAERVATLVAPKRGIDLRMLRVSALLHDIGRYKTHDPIQHGVEGYRLLTRLGHHQEAFVCASHVLCGMDRSEAVLHGLPERDFLPGTFEEKLIPLIDSTVEGDRPTTVEQRCSSIRCRYRDNPLFLNRFKRAEEAAQLFARELESTYGIHLEQIAADVLQQ